MEKIPKKSEVYVDDDLFLSTLEKSLLSHLGPRELGHMLAVRVRDAIKAGTFVVPPDVKLVDANAEEILADIISEFGDHRSPNMVRHEYAIRDVAYAMRVQLFG